MIMNSATDHADPMPAGPVELNGVLVSLDTNAKLGQAADLARAGRYGDAEGVLRSIQNWESIAAALDLMARVAAQQGKLEAAMRYWESAIKLAPSNLSYQAGLEYATRQKKPVAPPIRILVWILRSAGFLVLAVIVLLAGKQVMESTSTSEAASRVQVATLQSRVEGLYVAAVPAATKLPAATQQPTPDSASEIKSISISIDGLDTMIIGDGLVVFPKADMFDYNWSFAPGAPAMLTELGRQLEPYSNRVRITLVGFKQAAEGSDYFDLGLTRAILAYSQMRETTKLPSAVFLIEPAEAFLDSPYAPALERTKNLGKYLIVILRMSR